MRKTNFRVWCKNEKRWEPDVIFLSAKGIVFHMTRLGHLSSLKSDSHIVQLATGLKDMEGREIYEGDIVIDDEGALVAVQWAEGMGAWGILDDDNCMLLLADYIESLKVIGNIYENGELLNGQ